MSQWTTSPTHEWKRLLHPYTPVRRLVSPMGAAAQQEWFFTIFRNICLYSVPERPRRWEVLDAMECPHVAAWNRRQRSWNRPFRRAASASANPPMIGYRSSGHGTAVIVVEIRVERLRSVCLNSIMCLFTCLFLFLFLFLFFFFHIRLCMSSHWDIDLTSLIIHLK